MLRIYLQRQILGFLLLANIATAARYGFSIQEIHVNVPRDALEDDLFLVIASNAGSSISNKTWSVGSVKSNSTVTWNNITQEIDVPANAANLSVALGGFNAPDQNDDQVLKLVQGIVGVAAMFPGPQAPALRLLNLIASSIGELFKCDGPVILGNVVYAKDTLNNMNQHQKDCETKNYTFEAPHKLPVPTCGIDNSSYTVTYCLERLDAKGAATNMLPSFYVSSLGLAIALLYGLAL